MDLVNNTETGEDLHKQLCDEAIRLGSPELDRNRPVHWEAQRRVAARELTSLLEGSTSFSYLRLGDCELSELLAFQRGFDSGFTTTRAVPGKKQMTVAGGPGLSSSDLPMLHQAFSNCDYLDLHEIQPFQNVHCEKLNLDRPANTHQNSGIETSKIIYDWMIFEFKNYCQNHRVLFAGAEAGILEQLSIQDSFADSANKVWPSNIDATFCTVGTAGLPMEEIREILVGQIRRHKPDTIFLSLGGKAKTLCYELAKSENIRALDFGAMMRGLTYSGSPGHLECRARHFPFFHRVSFDSFMRAFNNAFPNKSRSHRIAKAHAQLCLEVQRKEFGWNTLADTFDPKGICHSKENLSAFYDSHREYKKLFPRRSLNADQIALENEFYRWCRGHGLFTSGKISVQVRKVRSVLGRIKRGIQGR